MYSFLYIFEIPCEQLYIMDSLNAINSIHSSRSKGIVEFITDFTFPIKIPLKLNKYLHAFMNYVISLSTPK